MEENEFKTPFQWCRDINVRVLDLNEWPLEWYGSKEKHFFEFADMPKNEFLEALTKCRVKPNSLQRKTDKYLEYKMYGLGIYQFAKSIHAGIQHGHTVVRYGRVVRDMGEIEETYNNWADKNETFIILNGGTTNNNPERLGMLNKHLARLKNAGIQVQDFYEPDLNDALTAICFLVDERAWDRETYPDFVAETLPWNRRKPSQSQLDDLAKKNAENYLHWVEKIGGEKNVFLREFLRPLKTL